MAIAWCVCTTMTLSGVSAAAPQVSQSKTNIVLCLADDLGWGDVGYNDNAVVQTPTLDAMAAGGVRFDQFYAAAPVCSPTRGSFITGRHPVRYGVFAWGWSLRPAEITLAEILGPAGYTTGHFGKWHLGGLHPGSATSPAGQGFDEFVSSPNFYENDPLFSRNGTVIETQGESSEVTVDAALDFIAGAVEKQRPFAAVICFGNPHTPHVALDRLKAPYSSLAPRLQNYWGEITGIDQAMGKLRRRLRELKIADDTLLLFTSDNGAAEPGSTGGLRGKKGTLWEGGIRVPAVAEWPRRWPEPRRIGAPCGTVDVLPTVLAAAGLKHPQVGRPLDGENLLPLIDAKSTERSRPLGFWTYLTKGKGMRSASILTELKVDAAVERPALSADEQAAFAARYSADEFPGHAAWIDGRFKLHRIPGMNSIEKFELYDLAADPMEQHDLASAEPERTASMKAALETWQRSVLNSLNGGDDETR